MKNFDWAKFWLHFVFGLILRDVQQRIINQVRIETVKDEENLG